MEFKRDPRFGRMIPAMVTPFNADLELDLDRAQELADRLVRGADALIVSGTTGESPRCSTPRSSEVFRAVVRAVNNRIPVIANVGDNCTADTVYFAQGAAKQGVDGYMSSCPTTTSPRRTCTSHFKTIADSTDMPIILHNIPGRCSINMEGDTTLRLAPQLRQRRGHQGGLGRLRSDQVHHRQRSGRRRVLRRRLVHPRHHGAGRRGRHLHHRQRRARPHEGHRRSGRQGAKWDAAREANGP